MTAVQNKKRVLLAFLYLVLALWVGFIFYNSSLCADDSNESSGFFVRFFIERIMGLDFESTDEDTLAFVTKLVRKAAHFTEYAILSAILFFIVVLYRGMCAMCVVIPTATSFVIAMLDELSQRFASGRSPQISDVLIDTAGALIASLVLLFALSLITKIKEKYVR